MRIESNRFIRAYDSKSAARDANPTTTNGFVNDLELTFGSVHSSVKATRFSLVYNIAIVVTISKFKCYQE